MYGHRAWGHYYCPFLLVFLLTKMAFNGGKWPQCLSQSLTWPLDPGVFLRQACAILHIWGLGSTAVLPTPLFNLPSCCEPCWHFVLGYHKSKWCTWVAANCFCSFSFVCFCFCCCLPAWFLFVSFVLFLIQDVKLTVSEMMCEIELWHRKWRALNSFVNLV